MARLKIVITILFILNLTTLHAQDVSYEAVMNHWVDSVLKTMSQDEKIGQIMVIRCASDETDEYYDDISRQVLDYHVGGICFFKGDAKTQVELTNRFQSEATIPLFICMDAEWGPSMRLVGQSIEYPKQLTLGAIGNDSLIYLMGGAIADELYSLGVNVSFAPVVDINNNKNNPVINFRSFGEIKENVAKKGIMYMKGLQDNGIAAVAKHFPGHGDTDVDSHLDLPVIKHSYAHLDSIELYPFKQIINAGVSGVMNAHIYFPELVKEKFLPSSLSKTIVTDVLRNKLNFNGITFSDGLEMNALFKYAVSGDIEAVSLNAGNDVQLLPINIKKSISTIKNWIENGKIPQQRLDDACRNILKIKYMLGGNDIKERKIPTDNLHLKLNQPDNKQLVYSLYKSAITVSKNDNILPLSLNVDKKYKCLVVGNGNIDAFKHSFEHYADIEFIRLNPKADAGTCRKVEDELKTYDNVIVLVTTSSNSIKSRFGLSQDVLHTIDNIANAKNSVLCIAANPYLGTLLSKINDYKAVMFAYEVNDMVLDIIPKSLFGANDITGTLPVTINDDMPAGKGIIMTKQNVLMFPNNDEAARYETLFTKVDSIVTNCLADEVFPGCQIFVAHKGKVLLNKSYGYLNYDRKQAVTENTLYDVASITKMCATTLAVMKLQKDNLLDVDETIDTYLPRLHFDKKHQLVIRDMMAHAAKLPPFINFHKQFNLEDFRTKYSSMKATPDFTVKVADDFYVSNEFVKKMFDSIAHVPLLKGKKLPKNHYVYSDLGFILLGRAIKNVTGTSLDTYIEHEFYAPMGLNKTVFNPLDTVGGKSFSKNDIAPTERDVIFREQLLQGYVHDQTAALQGGVSGHAGLFSTARQIGTIMQMLLQQGNYGGVQYLDAMLISDFTSTQYPELDNRRALGFDKPLLDGGKNGPVCQQASAKSFGHSGFTGCYAWADPENQLVYVFLSNRVCPNADNNKLSSRQIRSKIHEIVYNVVKDIE